MATRTLAELRTEARQRADSTADDGFIADAELTRYINQSIKDLYDLLVENQGQDFYYNTSTTATVAGTATYALPADFYQLLAVDLNIGSSRPVSGRPFVMAERNNYRQGVGWTREFGVRYRIHGSNINFIPPPTAVQSFTLFYVPKFTDLSGDTETFDGINGWEEYVVVDAAMKMIEKEEGDISQLMARKEALILRIRSLAKRRDKQPERVTDIYTNDWPWWE